jgi:DNA-binding NarL/FixJ family response regulator
MGPPRLDTVADVSVRVLVVDDDPLVRGALTLMMGGREDVVVVGEAADGRECRAAVPRLRPDVVLMDLRMPVLGGLEATRELQRRPDPPRVIVLTTFDADEHVLGAVAAGAEGFLLKDTGPHHILEAVLRVASGEPMLSPTATRSLISQVRTVAAADRTLPARQRLDVLTERERDVALAVGRGMSNAEIARELHLSVPTVKAHVSRLLDKLQSPTASRSRSSSTTPGWCEHPSL